MKLKINVTKDILKKSAFCGEADVLVHYVSTNCAIALAIRDLFPYAWIYNTNVQFLEADNLHSRIIGKCELPKKAIKFILNFDVALPEERMKMRPISFEIEIPEEVIETINIEEALNIVSKGKTMELILD